MPPGGRTCYTNVYTSWCVAMPTNLAIDDNLIEEARRIGHHKTKKEAVTSALSEYIAHRKRLEILTSFGTIDFDPQYDYKAERKRKR
jgi:Arc/MetJ family transcription regulator